MLWFFVILGLAILTAGLHGLVMGVLARSSSAILQTAVIALALVAWKFGHASVTGWIALAAAGLFELQSVLMRYRTSVDGGRPAREAGPPPPPPKPVEKSPAAPRPADVNPPTLEREAPVPLQESVPMRSLTSWALFRSPWDGGLDVLVASLRRAGQRDARKLGSSEVQIGSSVMRLVPVPRPAARDVLEDAIAQNWDWPDASAVAGGHAGHAVLTSRTPEPADCSEVVRLHLRAHAALAEFAPVCAILWPDGRRLSKPLQSAETSEGALQQCVSFRTFSLVGAEAGKTLCDTAGLRAFGLPDLQIVCDGEPDESISRLLYQLAAQIFREGCTWKDGEALRVEGRDDWGAHLAPARFPPARTVWELRARSPDS